MSVVTEWVMQIIVFILLGTIVELLIPKNAMKKYVNIVIGLLLLLILAKPILYLFSIDVNAELERIDQMILNDNQTYQETETLMEKQKSEIQAEQDAYIWSEVKLQLMNEANPVLKEKYSLKIIDILFSFDDSIVDNYDNLKQVVVTLHESNSKKGETNKESIQPITIQLEGHPETSQNKSEDRKKENKIKKELVELWGLDITQIQIKWEGGTS